MDDIDNKKKLLESLYEDRKNFTIIALTGYVSTGCTRLAELMECKFERWSDLRSQDDLCIDKVEITDNEDLLRNGRNNHESIGKAIFKRKYTICYDYIKAHYIPFKVIKYSSVLLFYCCRYWAEKRADGITLKDYIKKLLEDKYRPSREEIDDEYRRLRYKQPYVGDFDFSSERNDSCPWWKATSLDKLQYYEWDSLEREFKEIGNDKEKLLERAAALFFGNAQETVFTRFCNALIEYLWKEDPYCTDFFFHRLSYVIRASGDPQKMSKEVFEEESNDGSCIYLIVDTINTLIKGYKVINQGVPRRFVIDKIRNSLEAKYLKERYSAFYLVAVHDDDNVSSHLKQRIESRYATEEEIKINAKVTESQIKRILRFDMHEREAKDFENGKFFAPNTAQCVADAEIHLSNATGTDVDIPYFHSLAEQWMKYAALIQHPGLITPSSEERCMVVAYTAKFNSGCLSRQVGAVITNEAHSIRTIGWNDVPYGQIPCSLRQLPEMAKDNGERNFLFYSRYEKTNDKPLKDGESFGEKVRIKFLTT